MSHTLPDHTPAPSAPKDSGAAVHTVEKAQLTASQVGILRGAAKREDHFANVSERTAAARHKTIENLLRRGLLVEVPAQSSQPVWRTDDSGQAMCAAVTQAGLASLAACSAAPNCRYPVEQNAEINDASSPTIAETIIEPPASTSPVDKIGSKRDLIIGLMRSSEGASIGAMMAVTGWLPHTTRAALTGLRQKGIYLERSVGADGKSVYRIADPPQQPAGLARQVGDAA